MTDSRRPRGYDGTQWWSRRSGHFIDAHTPWTKWWKRVTHKRERRVAADDLLDDWLDDEPLRIVGRAIPLTEADDIDW